MARQAKKKTAAKTQPTQVSRVVTTSHEVMRRQLDGLQLIVDLEVCATEYDRIAKEMKTLKNKVARLRNDAETKVLNTQLAALRAQADVVDRKASLHLRRLKFILPEYQAVKFEQPEDDLGKQKRKEASEVISEARGLLETIALKRGEIAKH